MPVWSVVWPARSRFRVASVSKLFPIIGVLQLAEQGRIDLEADVNDYLADFHITNPFAEPLRVRHLLTHTDGFGARDLATFALRPDRLRPLGVVLAHDLDPPVQEPGRLITYGSYGTALAGHLVEQVSGLRFEEAMDRLIFGPLGMQRSSFAQDLPPDVAREAAVVYTYDESRGYQPMPPIYSNTPPTGGLRTTASDMAQVLIALLNGGRAAEGRILGERMAQAMIDRQFTPHPGLPGVTYGFMEEVANGRRALTRDGSGMGVRARVYLLPEQHLGYFYAQNSAGDAVVEALNRALLDHCYPAARPAPRPLADAHVRARRYAGVYRPTQTNDHTLVKIEALAVGELRVTAGPDGSLTITPLGMGDVWGGFAGSSTWVEVAPQLFQRVDREQYAAFGQEAGRHVTHLFSGAGYHGTYRKLPWHDGSTVQLSIAAVCLLVFLVTPIAWLSSAAFGTAPPQPGLARLARGLGAVVSVLDLVGLLGLAYALLIRRVAGFPAMAAGISSLAAAMLGVLLFAAVLGAGLAILTVLAWKDGFWSFWGRLHYTLLTIASLTFTGWLAGWNLLGFRY